ncbi:MAG TPA: histidine phosphatase family protein [Actinomycetota bacterium]|nr:histidine phosphatase family protein [Actinomycetota bacterium]
MILFLVRHALTPVTGQKLIGRLPGFALSEKGRKQAEATGLRLADAPLKAVFSSPMERCTETAEAIAGHHRLKVQVVEDLAEIDYGSWQGRSLKSLNGTKSWKLLRARPADFRFPGGETIREAQSRGMAAVENIRLKHKDKVVVACSHCDMIKLIVAACLGLGIDLYDRINIAPASITTLHLSEGTPHLINASDTGGYSELFDSLSKASEPAGKAAPRQGKAT